MAIVVHLRVVLLRLVKHYRAAETLAYLPLFERTGSHAIRFRAKDMVEAASIMAFIGDYQPDLAP